MKKYLMVRKKADTVSVRRPKIRSVGRDEWESCVLCGKKTSIRSDTDINRRTCYVEGCGQLCGECFQAVYQER